MKILVATYRFYPDVGGLETVARVLSEEFVAMGHEVALITETAPSGSGEEGRFPFPVWRRPGARRMLSLIRWCDVYFQNNISLRTAWALLLVRRPWVMSHQTWVTRVSGREGWQDRVKKFVIRFGSPIAISKAIAQELPVRATLIGNPYQDTQFRVLPGAARTRDLVLLARLVSDKGADILLEALAELRGAGLTPNLTVVGDGPEMDNLQRLAVELGVAAQVTFAGVQTGEALVRILNEHRVMVVPSRLPEPFGVVALEGIACGCVVVGSERGGLSDAIGSCGLTFPNGDAHALAGCLRRALEDPAVDKMRRDHAPAHLEKHSSRRIAEAYLRVFEEAAR